MKTYCGWWLCSWWLTYLINSKEARGKACEIWLKLRSHKDMATFQTLQNMDRSCCNDWKVAISFSKCNLSHFEGVTTHYQTRQTWIGLNLTRYRNLNALLQALLHVLLYVFSEIFLVLSYLQRVATRYHHFLKIYILIYIFFINLTVTR